MALFHSYHYTCDKRNNQPHLSLSQERQLLSLPHNNSLLAPLFLPLALALAPVLSPQSLSPHSLCPQGSPGLTLCSLSLVLPWPFFCAFSEDGLSTKEYGPDPGIL